MADQLPLFPTDDVAVPNPLELLRQGAALVLSVSGGKDSDAMSHWLLDQRTAEGWCGPVKMVHADLGRADWHMTGDYVEGLAQRQEVELHVVRWSDGDLIDRIWQRWEKDKTRPCWPSAAARYCTSDLKRGPISRWIRHTFPTGTVICAMGLRAGESHARARGRRVLNWLPIHDWAETDVWDCIRQHGNIHHEAYKYGNDRLSCACCVLANPNDLLNGAIHNPATYQELCRIEAVTGYSFKKDCTSCSLD